MGFITKEHITAGVYILDVAEEHGIELESAASGNFDYRCRCPSSEHKNGNERTGSLYIDSRGNNFYCFGCGASSNVIDFYMLCNDVDFSSALSELRQRIDPKNAKKVKSVKKNSNFPVLLKISNLFRKTMLEHPKDLKWINKMMKQTDGHMSNLKTTDIENAKKLFNKLEKIFKERYS